MDDNSSNSEDRPTPGIDEIDQAVTALRSELNLTQEELNNSMNRAVQNATNEFFDNFRDNLDNDIRQNLENSGLTLGSNPLDLNMSREEFQLRTYTAHDVLSTLFQGVNDSETEENRADDENMEDSDESSDRPPTNPDETSSDDYQTVDSFEIYRNNRINNNRIDNYLINPSDLSDNSEMDPEEPVGEREPNLQDSEEDEIDSETERFLNLMPRRPTTLRDANVDDVENPAFFNNLNASEINLNLEEIRNRQRQELDTLIGNFNNELTNLRTQLSTNAANSNRFSLLQEANSVISFPRQQYETTRNVVRNFIRQVQNGVENFPNLLHRPGYNEFDQILNRMGNVVILENPEPQNHQNQANRDRDHFYGVNRPNLIGPMGRRFMGRRRNYNYADRTNRDSVNKRSLDYAEITLPESIFQIKSDNQHRRIRNLPDYFPYMISHGSFILPNQEIEMTFKTFKDREMFFLAISDKFKSTNHLIIGPKLAFDEENLDLDASMAEHGFRGHMFQMRKCGRFATLCQILDPEATSTDSSSQNTGKTLHQKFSINKNSVIKIKLKGLKIVNLENVIIGRCKIYEDKICYYGGEYQCFAKIDENYSRSSMKLSPLHGQYFEILKNQIISGEGFENFKGVGGSWSTVFKKKQVKRA